MEFNIVVKINRIKSVKLHFEEIKTVNKMLKTKWEINNQNDLEVLKEISWNTDLT